MNPTKILKTEYQELNYAITDGGHEYHCFYLATVNLKTPRLRTVVLRSFDKNKNFSIERVGGIKFLRKIRKAQLINEFLKEIKCKGLLLITGKV